MAALLLSDPRVRAYLDDVRAWHGYVRFLGLPTIQDHPDTPLSDLFVAPALSTQRVAPESPPSSWPSGQDVFSAIHAHRHLVVLGDPGSGKSMIVNWLAWLLAGGAEGVLPHWLDDMLPIPLVARELKLEGVKRFDDLLAAFLERPVAARLSSTVDLHQEILREGRALILLDGLDEVPLSLRESLRDAVLDGWHRYPNVRFLATSRIVGYAECALEPPHLEGHANQPQWPLESQQQLLEIHDKPAARVLYVMPFDDSRITAFASQWYRLRSIRPTAEQSASAFVRALLPEPNVLELARTPQLLTLMALVYRVRAHLPDGRAMLYDMITEAYLESIDRARSVGNTVIDLYPWREKRRWLARVGFEMQVLRGERRDSDQGQRELLATRGQVLEWVRDAMRRSSYPADDVFAANYLDWVARRSGLLLPRGEDLFAFVHLSFQEYFAALYIFEHTSDADWVIAQRDKKKYLDGDPRVSDESLAAWAKDPLWQEALVFAHECFAHSPKDARRLSGWLFGAGFSEFADSLQSLTPAVSGDTPEAKRRRMDSSARGELLARLLTNPHSGLAAGERELGMETIMFFFEHAEGRFEYFLGDASSSALRRLLASPNTRAALWAAIGARNPKCLDLRRAGELDLSGLSVLTRLRRLAVESIVGGDLSKFADHPRLESLWLSSAPAVVSLAPLAQLEHLRSLGIGESQLTDLSSLVELRKLTDLYLWGAPVVNFEPLRKLTSLEFLFVSNSKIASLDSLLSCRALKTLHIRSTPVEDLSPLEKLPKLQELHVSPRHKITAGLLAKQAAGKLKIWIDGRESANQA